MVMAHYYFWFHRPVLQDPIDGDAEKDWCENTALAYAACCLETVGEILTEAESDARVRMESCYKI